MLKFSKLVKEKDGTTVTLADDEFCSAVEQVAQELLGSSIIVEVEKA